MFFCTLRTVPLCKQCHNYSAVTSWWLFRKCECVSGWIVGQEGGNKWQMCKNKIFYSAFVWHLEALGIWKFFSSGIFTPYMGGRILSSLSHSILSSLTYCKLLLRSNLPQVVALLTWVQELPSSDFSWGKVFLQISLVFVNKCSDGTSKQAMTVSFRFHSVSCKCMKWEQVFCSQLILLPSVWMIDLNYKLNEIES